VTLNDLEQRNGHYFALFRGVFSPKQVAFVANYVKVVVISHQQIFSREMS